MVFRPQELRHPRRLVFAMNLIQLPQTCLLDRNPYLDMSPAPNAPGSIAGRECGIRGRDPGYKAARPRPLSTQVQNHQ